LTEIKLENRMDIRKVSNEWTEINDSDKPVSIDCSSLESADAAGYQMILFLIKMAREKPGEFSVVNFSDKLKLLLLKNGFDPSVREE